MAMPAQTTELRSAHPDMAREATRRYLRQVESLAADGRRIRATRKAAGSLAKTLKAALVLADRVGVDDMPFRLTALDDVPNDELNDDRVRFLNQYALGLGWDGAKVIVMGTEEAVDPDDPEAMAMRALYPALVLAECQPDLLRRLVEHAKTWDEVRWDAKLRPYHLNPDDYTRVLEKEGTSTWELVAKVVSPDPSAWRTLLGGNEGPGLGGLAYQIERSAVPAKQQVRGRPPLGERVQFMTDVVMPSLRQTASILLITASAEPSRKRGAHGIGR